MSEEIKTPETAKVEVQPKETISDAEIKAVETEIAKKDAEVINKIREDLSKEFSAKLETQLQEKQKEIESKYTQKFTDMEKKFEELRPRKGLVTVPNETPFQEISRQEQHTAQPQERKVTRNDLVNAPREVSYAGAEAFLANLRKK
jgi:phosphoribosylformylglycinamidine (FGAM) synthase PurS component